MNQAEMNRQDFSGTKEAIFDTAIVQIAEVGYDAANMRDIAAQAGIKASSIYNHFASKDEILNNIYAYYRSHFLEILPDDDSLHKAVEDGDKQRLIDLLFFTFENTDEKQYRRMILITKIIYMRIFSDVQARNIFIELMIKTPETRIKAALDYGISIGKLKAMDTWAYTRILSSTRNFIGLVAFSDINYVVGQLDEEQKLKATLAKLLVD